MEISASEPVLKKSRSRARNKKLTLDSLIEEFWLFKTAFDFLNIDSFMIWALKLKQTVEEGLVPYRSIFREMKKQKVRHKLWCISVKLHQVCLDLMPPLPSPPPLLPLPPLRQQGQPFFLFLLSLLSVKTMRLKTFVMIHFHLMISK